MGKTFRLKCLKGLHTAFAFGVHVLKIHNTCWKLRKIGPKIRKFGGNYVKPIEKIPFPGGKYIKPSRK